MDESEDTEGLYSAFLARFPDDASRERAQEIVSFGRALDGLASTPKGAELLADDPIMLYGRLMAKIRLHTEEKSPVKTLRRLKEMTGLSAAQIAEEVELPRGLVEKLLAGNPKARVRDLRAFFAKCESCFHLHGLDAPHAVREVRRDGAPMISDPRPAMAAMIF